MWRNIVELDSPQVTVWHMHIACYIPKAIDAYSESIIPVAFACPQWLHERAPMLHYTFITLLVKCDVTCLKFLMVKNECSYSCAAATCIHGVHRHTFTFMCP